MTGLETLTALARLARVTISGVPSPCISVCRMDERSGLCLGCYRSIDEIIDWGRQTQAHQHAVWQLIVQRAGLSAE